MKIQVIDNQSDAELFREFVPDKGFPYSADVLVDVVKRNIGANNTLFLKATNGNGVLGVAYAETISLPHAVHVTFLGSADKEATYSLMLALAKWAQMMGYDQIQHAVHKSPEAWTRLMGGGETISFYIRSGSSEELKQSMTNKLRRIKDERVS